MRKKQGWKLREILNNAIEENISHEIIHSIQDEMANLSYDKSSINNEYETAWLVTLSKFLQNGAYSTLTLGISEQQRIEMYLELERYVIPNETNRYSLIIQDGFFSVLLQYCTGHEESFSETMKKICNNDPRHDEYWHSYDKDYIYDWKGMLERLGYK